MICKSPVIPALSLACGHVTVCSHVFHIYYRWQNSNFQKKFLIATIDLSIGSTETKYIKLSAKTQNIFCCVNENLTTFLYTLTRGARKQKEKKVFFFKVYTKVECYFKKIGFKYLVLCIWFQ
jgi:hypothetical protein